MLVEISSVDQLESVVGTSKKAVLLVVRDSLDLEPMVPVMQEVSNHKDFHSIVFAWIPFGNVPGSEADLGVISQFPTIVYLLDGEEVFRTQNSQSASDICGHINEFLHP